MLRILRVLSKHSKGVGNLRYASSAAREFVNVKEQHGVREITLNHPRTLNSLSLGLMEELHKAMLDDIDNVELRCIVISATGKIWSAGHNLRELKNDPETNECVFQKLTDIIRDIQRIPVPVIAKVNGYAAAAGCQLAASCDMLICSDISKFSTPGASVGVFCTTPGVAISRLMSRQKSAYMLMTGLPISGTEAFIAGLASKVVPEEELDDAILEAVCAIKSKSRAVIGFGKKFFYKQIGLPIDEAYERGKKIMCDNLQLPDCKEGIQSFIEKRSPKWKHE